MADKAKFQELRTLDVSKYVEKKGQFNYLAWAHCADILLQHDPSATWEYDEPQIFNETMMVFCTVHAFGKSMKAQLPVMNYKNQAIKNPDAMAVNTADITTENSGKAAIRPSRHRASTSTAAPSTTDRAAAISRPKY